MKEYCTGKIRRRHVEIGKKHKFVHSTRTLSHFLLHLVFWATVMQLLWSLLFGTSWLCEFLTTERLSRKVSGLAKARFLLRHGNVELINHFELKTVVSSVILLQICFLSSALHSFAYLWAIDLIETTTRVFSSKQMFGLTWCIFVTC